jgi:Asp-tRNA(Asn)/Glu-tRNA(Gln) amidotransferase A subunit family amidase
LRHACRDAAAAVDDAVARKSGGVPALAAVPFLVSEQVETTAPFATTAGLAYLDEWVPVRDSPVLPALVRVGGVFFGKASVQELGHGVTGVSADYGAAKNVSMGGSQVLGS